MAGTKRKSAASSSKTGAGTPSKGTKKSKTSPTASSASKALTEKEVSALFTQIDESRQYNSLVPLLEQYDLHRQTLAQGENEKVEALTRLLTLSLFKSFSKLFEQNLLVAKKSYDEKKVLIVKWLLEKYDTFKKTLLAWLSTADFKYETSIQLDMLDIYMSLIQLETKHMSSSDAYFPTQTYKRLVENLLVIKTFPLEEDGTARSSSIITEFNEKYFQKYWDLQFYFFHTVDEASLTSLKDTATAAASANDESAPYYLFGNFYSLTISKAKLLFSLEDQEAQPSWSTEQPLPSIAYKPSTFKSAFQKAVITVLSSFPLQTVQYKAILLVLHKRIIPYMAQPQNLMDFLTDCYNVTDDEVVPILALNSLYELMKRYNLEYPDFYAKLYSLLTPNLLYTRYRSRFFRLCDLFLSSTHISSQLVASFIKRLARLSLRGSASGVVIVIPFVYNLMKRHPSCMIMLHNPRTTTTEKGKYVDPYKPNEADPLKTDAIKSSLWELETLMSHYHPNIATLAKIFSEPFRKHSYNMEDFLDWSYITLLDSEKTRRYRITAALEYQEWDQLLGGDEPQESTYLSGWTF